MTVAAPRLVLAAHGSGDPRFADVVTSLVAQLRASRPSLDVAAGYLDHGPPHLPDVAARGSVVVPLLLSNGFHVSADIPAQAPGCRVTRAAGPDRRLTGVLVDRLREAGRTDGQDVVLAAAGSADPVALDDVRQAAGWLAEALGVAVTAAFAAAGEPRLADLRLGDHPSVAVASYLLAPGRFAEVIAGCGAAVVSAPVGPAPQLAEILLDRYDRA